MAAVLEAGPTAIASHRSAAWMWGLGAVPERHAVTLSRNGPSSLPGIEVHRLAILPIRPVIRAGIPCTNPLRTLVDLAAVEAGEVLDEAVDRALAHSLVTLEGIHAEIGRLSQRGRRGTGVLREALRRRGLVEPPEPSVLESKTLRLLHAAGIRPVGVEVVHLGDGRYRLDVLLRQSLAMEVDGFVHHFSPEAKARDELRRNRIRLDGTFLLVFTWRDVVHDGFRVISEVREAMDLTRPIGGTLKR